MIKCVREPLAMKKVCHFVGNCMSCDCEKDKYIYASIYIIYIILVITLKKKSSLFLPVTMFAVDLILVLRDGTRAQHLPAQYILINHTFIL